ncbi:MAG: right-handed parallel beta-helix repeat-containing protein, partial [Phycisphaerales bacterium]|nr:right-handed parallel beta-helix repeat-containing protein [Phycisphaerales bacterium]
MKVFKSAITVFVISMVLSGANAEAAWVYPVDSPQKPTLTKVKTLHNPTMGQIQNAIAPKTRVNIIGDVDASGGERLHVNVDDVRLNFAKANKIYWSGGDTWEGFVNISGSRVQVQKLKMEVQGGGRCRGAVVETPASDIKIVNCEFTNVADGLVADGDWARLAIVNTKFLNCSDWAPGSMDGGYGMFLEDDDWDPDHLLISNVQVTLSSNSWQHGTRISQAENVLIEDSEIGAMQKRSLWAYGVRNMAVRNSIFNTGSMLFNLKPDELYTSRPVENVRISNCTINHSSILQPLGIYCGHGTVNFRFKNVDVFSSTNSKWLTIGYTSGDVSENIRWPDGSITFNGNQIWGLQSTTIDWS